VGPAAGRVKGLRDCAVPHSRKDVDLALSAIETFVTHVRTEPGRELYLSFRDRDDPTRFTHLMVFADRRAEAAHGNSDAVRAFTEALHPLSDGPVGFERLELVASAGD
jgi:quinol monooxygenase YgiN